MRSFPKGNLDGVEGATKWRLERNRIVAVKSSDLRSGEDKERSDAEYFNHRKSHRHRSFR